ncbi:amino acid kinase family protein [Candidatus Vidania fulgoroideorum]
MKIVIQKYGGSSLGSISRLKRTAKRIKNWVYKGYKIIVVVSACYGFTNKLAKMFERVSNCTSGNEYDCFVSLGEQISSCLISKLLNNIKCSSTFLCSWQIPIVISSRNSLRNISYIEPKNIIINLKRYDAVIICGFQGVNKNGYLKILRRGGSDATASELSRKLLIKKCYIFTDVDGIYTLDPNRFRKALKLPFVDYFTAIEISSVGSKVLQIDSIYSGLLGLVRLYVISSLNKLSSKIKERKSGTSVFFFKKMIRSLFSSKEFLVRMIFKKSSSINSFFMYVQKELIELDFLKISKNSKSLFFTVNNIDINKIKKSNYYIFIEKIIEVTKISIIGFGIKNCRRTFYNIINYILKLKIGIYELFASEMRISFISSIRHEFYLISKLKKALGL